MTNREFFVVVAESNISEEITTKANELILALDHKNELRKSKDSKEKIESTNRRNAILEFFKDHSTEVFYREQIAEVLGFTLGQITSACTTLVKDGYLVKSEVKVDKSKKTAYCFNTEND